MNHETSLVVAAEVGSALFNENEIVKQNLHETQLYKAEHHLPMEEKILAAEKIIEELTEEDHQLTSEITFI